MAKVKTGLAINPKTLKLIATAARQRKMTRNALICKIIEDNFQDYRR